MSVLPIKTGCLLSFLFMFFTFTFHSSFVLTAYLLELVVSTTFELGVYVGTDSIGTLSVVVVIVSTASCLS